MCVCPSVCVCARVSVFPCPCMITQKHLSRNMKFKYIVVYENSFDEFNIGHFQIKVKVSAGVQTVFTFTAIQNVRSTLVQARKLILSIYIHLILIYKIYEYRYA